jgi:ammonia channel protein AmtB
MQLGFLMLETGAVKSTSVTTVVLKNTINFSVGILVFIWFGYGLAFGDTELQNVSLTSSSVYITVCVWCVCV